MSYEVLRHSKILKILMTAVLAKPLQFADNRYKPTY